MEKRNQSEHIKNNIPLIYCELCKKKQPMRIDWMRKDTDFPKQGIWGDICCGKCNLVLNNITVFEEGIYEFKKVAELPNGKT